ncbi:hypothetical protein [Paenibacillus sp. IHBB 10380]|uniref:hypothetical protein n=1 Tax=Paenibacillus sp. IHBB 10380 TaxID=1566358 RepID=UPI00118606F5|nr:hypothetical protein [Paenibacillus sp. IHBB 10380]
MRTRGMIGKGTTLLGYNADDVEGMIQSLTEARQEVEKLLIEEREAYLTESTSKIQEIEELRSLLDKARAEERSIIEGVTPQ